MPPPDKILDAQNAVADAVDALLECCQALRRMLVRCDPAFDMLHALRNRRRPPDGGHKMDGDGNEQRNGHVIDHVIP